jgi:hypothetical protein
MGCAGGMSEGPLVQPEGVNAGSAEEAAPNDEGERVAAPAGTRPGGHPEDAPERSDTPADDSGSGGPAYVGAPEPQEESGQDAGSL